MDARIKMRMDLLKKFDAVLKKPNATCEEWTCPICGTYTASRTYAIAEHCAAHTRADELEPREPDMDWDAFARQQAADEEKVRAGLRPLELD